jgi:Zn-dependent protease
MLFNRDISQLLLIVPPLLFSLTIHEFSHALAAHLLGDDTARDQGRLSLNPLRHLDFLGTLLILMSFLIGWAKPVPVNPNNFRHPARDMSVVAAAGPLSNLLMVFVAALLLNILARTGLFAALPGSFQEPLVTMLYLGFVLNISLCFFNLLPIPPLDGFKIASFFLPGDVIRLAYRYQLAFFLALIALIWLGGVRKILTPLILFFQDLLLGGVL